jgi:non-heme chloroperoxidase
VLDSRKFVLRDLTLVATEGGAHCPELVVFLHGAGQTRHSWRATVSAVAAAGYHVLSLDLRGHGDSEWAPGGDYCSDAFIGDLRQILQELGKPAVLVGASMGGLVALMMVGESDPEWVRGLVLVDITPRVEPAGRARVLGFMQSNPEGFDSVEAAAEVIDGYMPHRPQRKDLSGLRRNLRQGADGRYYWHWDPAFFEDPHATHADPEQRYARAAARVSIPTLIVRGERSELVSEESVRHVRELIPAAQYLDISGAHHMVAGDSNDVFTAAVVDFVCGITGQQGCGN